MSDKNESMINNSNEPKAVSRKKELVLNIISIICSLAVIVLVIVELIGLIPDAGDYYTPIMSLILLIQSYRFWETKRGFAIFSLIVGILGIAMTVIGIFM